MSVLTAASLISAAAALGGATYSVVEGERGARQQRRGLRDQRQAQNQAQAQAASQQREQQRATAAQNRDEPNLAALIAQATQGAGGGTFLGGRNANPDQVGRTTLLGQ